MAASRLLTRAPATCLALVLVLVLQQAGTRQGAWEYVLPTTTTESMYNLHAWPGAGFILEEFGVRLDQDSHVVLRFQVAGEDAQQPVKMVWTKPPRGGGKADRPMSKMKQVRCYITLHNLNAFGANRPQSKLKQVC